MNEDFKSFFFWDNQEDFESNYNTSLINIIICIKVNEVFQISGDQNLARAKTTRAKLPRVDYSPWFLFRRPKIEKKKKIPQCLSLIKLINFKILLIVNTFFKEIFNLCRLLLIITLYFQIKISINFLCR